MTASQIVRLIEWLKANGFNDKQIVECIEYINKSFTDDLAWSVQRELVNHYFRTRVAQKEKPERRQVVDIPRNPEYQKIFAKVRKNMDALDALMKGLNRYISQEDAEAYVKVIDSVGITILKLTDSIGRMKYGLMTEPY